MTSTLEMRLAARGAAITNGFTKTIWHSSAPQQVRQAFRAGDPSNGWAGWREHLSRRGHPEPLDRLLPGTTWPLAWALPDGAASTGTVNLLAELQRIASRPIRRKSAETLVLKWVADASTAVPSALFALEALAFSHAMPRLASSVSSSAWWQLFAHLLATVDATAQLDLDEDPLVDQLLCGELGLTLAYLLPELAPCRRLATPARKTLSTGLVSLLDGEGLPHGRHLHRLRPLLACWTRCRAMGGCLPQGAWNSDIENQYQWLVRAALRLARHDGSQVLAHGSAGAWCKDLLQTALEFGGDHTDRRIASLVLPGVTKPKRRPAATLELPAAANHSEWAALTVLRPGWLRTEPRLTVVYPGRDLDAEFESGSELFWSGRWQTEIQCDGQPAKAVSDWEEVCWVSDEDVDYLELEMQLTGGLRVQRHLLMARQQRFLLVADSVLGRRAARLNYRSILPISSGVTFQPADETHEGFLVGKSRRALVLPLALPEWRCDPRAGRLGATERGLELEQSAAGRCLFAPLWFDLDARRMRRSLTWRQLTVAENRQVLAHDAAVGYRVMVGNRQWLIYRSLAPTANRTLLGHNLSTQMLVGTFDGGAVEPLLAIE